MDNLDVITLDADEAVDHVHSVAEIWTDAFGPMGDLDRWRENTFDRHRAREAYRLTIARCDGVDAGFAWGYIGHRGEYWPDLVLERLGEAAEPLVGGHVEFVELAVHHVMRNRGIGTRMHDALLDALPARPALLGTSADPADPGARLYRRHGWRTIGTLDAYTQVMAHPARASR